MDACPIEPKSIDRARQIENLEDSRGEASAIIDWLDWHLGGGIRFQANR
jgi:hypothetical protein